MFGVVAGCSLRAKLTDKYGEPSRDEENVPDQCRSSVVSCLRDGRATHFVEWTWYSADGVPISVVLLEFYTVDTHDTDAISSVYVNADGMKQISLRRSKEQENL